MKPTITVITPLHAPGNAFVGEAYECLKAQKGAPPWEWLVLENAGGELPKPIRGDARVRVLSTPSGGIGALKHLLCSEARGIYVVELDADDLLAPSALREVGAALRPDVDFVYSDFAEFRWEGKGKPWTPVWMPDAQGLGGYPYMETFGWSHYDAHFKRHPVIAMRAPEATEHNLRMVDWAPNHLRAWRLSTYKKVGGHDAGMEVGDDHDLMVRLKLGGARFRHIPKCLYFYRVHAANTVATKNAAIRAATARTYSKNIWALGKKWCEDRKLLEVDLCGGVNPHPGMLVLDRDIPDSVDGRSCDLDGPWPLADSSVGLLRAYDALEHLVDPVHTMNEAYRVLAPGGWMFISVPSTNGKGAFCDPTHKSFWNDLSFRYYCSKAHARYVRAFEGKFQASRVMEWFPDVWHAQNHVPYVEAHLFCAKDGFRAMGEWLW